MKVQNDIMFYNLGVKLSCITGHSNGKALALSTSPLRKDIFRLWPARNLRRKNLIWCIVIKFF